MKVVVVTSFILYVLNSIVEGYVVDHSNIDESEGTPVKNMFKRSADRPAMSDEKLKEELESSPDQSGQPRDSACIRVALTQHGTEGVSDKDSAPSPACRGEVPAALVPVAAGDQEAVAESKAMREATEKAAMYPGYNRCEHWPEPEGEDGESGGKRSRCKTQNKKPEKKTTTGKGTIVAAGPWKGV